MSAPALLLSAALLAGAPEPRLEVVLSPREITVGDRIEAVLTLQAPAAAAAEAPRFPAWGRHWGEAEVVSTGPVEELAAPSGLSRFRQRLELAAFRPGEIPLPPVAVRVPSPRGSLEVRSPEGLAISVRSLLPPGADAPEPRPPAPPRPLPLGAGFWWTTAAVAGACLLAAAALRRRTAGAPGPAGEEASLDPTAELLRDLQALDPGGDPVAFHAALSLALRRYLGRTLGFPAPESTPTEIQRRLLNERVPPGVTGRTARLLRSCDLVKFARQPAAPQVGTERRTEARRIAAEIQAHGESRPEPLEAAG